ncbi:NAD+ synthase [Candidatus Nitrosotenuis sp. DW1]|uniref:NAD+ synthase n=1 Tax=Candidatus Nitrosotenuis sp. DW1 TaxID=2259672 RepID=UPI0015C9AB52|nr:NAD+ synthase [Candidatus Nitrosotenuis sp. DW1]QLH09052.1 NAD(+) synthetase [Candidatus Nitrosotenuis sp. DW1]
MNKQVLDEITNQDYAKIQSNVESFLRESIAKAGASGLVFGLSGGIDSAVVAHICAKSFKEKSLALLMPDSRVSPKEETEDALQIVDKLGLDYKIIDISLIHSQFANIVEPEEKSLGNLRARIRATLLYYHANLKNYLVIGSSDKSEQLIGYFTKFGDGSADVLPIASLYKTQIRLLAKHLGVKESIIQKKSSPHLWKGHIAEDEIGASYEEIDSILYCMTDKNMSLDDIQRTTQIDSDKIEKIHQLYKKSEHKRIMPSRL